MYYARALPSQSESSRWRKTRNGRQSSGARRACERVCHPFEPEPYDPGSVIEALSSSGNLELVGVAVGQVVDLGFQTCLGDHSFEVL
jgi:hypothetical protein